MLPSDHNMTETFDSLLTRPINHGREHSGARSMPSPVPVDMGDTLSHWDIEPLQHHTTALSPPPTPMTKPSTSRPEKLSIRLRTDSGLALHTNQAAFRRYTDYNPDGSTTSPLSPTFTLGPGLASPGLMANIDMLSAGTLAVNPLREHSAESFISARTPLLDLFHRDVLQMVLQSPATGQRLCRFAQRKNNGANAEFLLKIEEYFSALKAFTSVLDNIVGTFTSATATTPLALPHELSNNINVHMKHFVRSMLPLLEKIFRDARIVVQDRVAKDIYPEFIKYQFTLCLKSSLSTSRAVTGGSFKSAYPGLGDAFCLTDPNKPDNPVVYASDALVHMSGFPRDELLQRNCRLMQGRVTDESTVQRIKEAMVLRRNTSEMILNYRKDGSAFWNLLFISPLMSQGKMRYFFGAQINVSESMGSRYADILRVLNFGSPLGEFSNSTPEESAEGSCKRTADDPRRRSERRFFKTFSRRSNLSTLSSARPDAHRPCEEGDSPPPAPAPARPPPRRLSTPATLMPEDVHTPYSLYFVMRYVPPDARSLRADRSKHGASTAPHLPVAFCSAQALELVCLGPRDGDALAGLDVFAVLADLAGSPTISRTFKAAVRDRLQAGESISTDLVVNPDAQPANPRRAKKPGMLGLASRNKEPAAAEAATPGGPNASAERLTLAEALASPSLAPGERVADSVSIAFFGPKMRKMVSHWTPLKDEDGKVGFVVLTMTPAAS